MSRYLYGKVFVSKSYNIVPTSLFFLTFKRVCALLSSSWSINEQNFIIASAILKVHKQTFIFSNPKLTNNKNIVLEDECSDRSWWERVENYDRFVKYGYKHLLETSKWKIETSQINTISSWAPGLGLWNFPFSFNSVNARSLQKTFDFSNSKLANNKNIVLEDKCPDRSWWERIEYCDQFVKYGYKNLSETSKS